MSVCLCVLMPRVVAHSFISVMHHYECIAPNVRRHQWSPEWVILSQISCFVQSEVKWFQVLLDSLILTWCEGVLVVSSSSPGGKGAVKVFSGLCWIVFFCSGWTCYITVLSLCWCVLTLLTWSVWKVLDRFSLNLTSLIHYGTQTLGSTGYRLTDYLCTFSYTAPAAWNNLPPSLQQLSNTTSFKRHLETFLFQHTFSHWFLVGFMYFLYC